MVHIEPKRTGAITYAERIEYDTPSDGTFRQMLNGFVFNTGSKVIMLQRDADTHCLRTAYLDMEFRDTEFKDHIQIKRMRGHCSGITINGGPRTFSSGIYLEATSEPRYHQMNLRTDSFLGIEHLGLFEAHELPARVIRALSVYGNEAPESSTSL